MKRRSFIKHTTHSIAIPSILGSFGFGFSGTNSLEQLLKMTTETGRKLILIFLEGGNDGLNTVIPLNELSKLNQFRPQVVMPEQRLIRLPGNHNLGLHPSLSGLNSLYKEGRLQIIQSVAYPEPNLSHFRSSDIWFSASDSDQLLSTGWMGRYVEHNHPNFPNSYPNQEFTDPLAIEIGYNASILFQGSSANMGMVISGPNSFYDLVNNVYPPTPNSPSGDKLKYIHQIARQSQSYRETILRSFNKQLHQLPFPETSLAQQLKIISKLIAGGLNTPIYMVRINGFDTHAEQVEQSDKTTGMHAQLLKQLDDAILAFQKDIDHHGLGDEVVGMTFSEFGRKIISNGSHGTDHGSSAPLFVFGNKVKGGILGTAPVIPNQVRWDTELSMQYDFRQVYSSVLNQWMGMENSATNTVMQREFEPIEIIGQTDIITGSSHSAYTSLKVYPNPVGESTKIEFMSDGGMIEIAIFDLNGRKISTIHQQKEQAGIRQITWNGAGLSSGRYIISLQSATSSETIKILK